jgi:hypothetical protein
MACAELRLARPAYLPLRTFRDKDFEASDPLDVILGALSKVEAGERMLAQLVLAPAPKDWGSRYYGSARAIEAAQSGGAPGQAAQPPNFALALFWVGVAFFPIWAFLMFMTKEWLTLLVAVLSGIVVCALLWKLQGLSTLDANADPVLIKQKVNADARRVRIRLFAFGPQGAPLHSRLQQVSAAYEQLNLEAGNQLQPTLLPGGDPTDLIADPLATWNVLGLNVRPWFRSVWDILNVNELAALWHLPRNELNVPGMRVADAMQLAPTSDAFTRGMLIGHHISADGRRVPIHLPDEATRRHMLMVAKTQYGKSTLIARLMQLMMQDRTRGLVIVDPASDLARQVIRLVPDGRRNDVVYVNLGDADYPVAFNPLDATLGRPPEKIVADLVKTFSVFWDKNWGPRMGEYFQKVTKAMCVANVDIVSDQRRPQDQYTLLDIVPVLQQYNAAKRLFGFMDPQRSLDHSQLHTFYEDDFLKMWVEDQRQFREIVLPIITKMGMFTQYRATRATLGQPVSSVNFSQIVRERKLLFVNCNAGLIGPDNAQLMGAIIINMLASAISEQAQIEQAAARAPVTIVIDEFQSYGHSIDIPSFLALMAKYGANFVLATQTVELLRETYPDVYHTLLTNTSTLFTFQTSYRDAEALSREMGDVIPARDITMLPRWRCYLSAVVDGRKQMPVSLETLPPDEPPDAAERAAAIIADARERYGREIEGVEQQLFALYQLKGSLPTKPSSGAAAPPDLDDPTEKY